MRCPNCGTDTTSSSPACMRCNAPLPPDDDATARDTTSRDATARDPFAKPPGAFGATPGAGPFGEVPVPRDPLPPPWAGQSPTPWEPAGDFTSPMPPSDERSTQLSPEPWAEPPEPWAEPPIWQPPPPPGRSRLPYLLGAAGAVVLLGVALAIVFWPSGSGDPEAPPAAVQESAPQESSPPTQGVVSETGDTGDLDAQAGAVNELLEAMGATRSSLGTVVEEGCTTSGLQRILDERRGQLEKARELEVGAMQNGTRMRDALIRALEASTESNQRYLDVAPGCPSEGEVSDVNERASSAKSEFIGYWTPIAEQAGLPARTESDI
ncbi:hypothetical protein HUT06_06015 [Actinomadura sp. NAK00032]|uniref:hypothetical protein n=1 Tax=Actinomadura sp. NAK00032 TaxID=2742128 RepID=UPI00159114FA|nr:hypothetical protein [Actinomadura sp. NAK00032]QKW33640.1 hypothetical protein HUT06_06015 [Actinomadura sp. NAK00032]